MERKKVLLAFSGGLDTTFCAVHLAKELKVSYVWKKVFLALQSVTR